MSAQSDKHEIVPTMTEDRAREHGLDHVPVRIGRGRGRGYKGLNSGEMGLLRCPECERENAAAAVATGQCCWCGWKIPGTGVVYE
jgi:ssDNA-binding Zn-finger/Zn-ribbon topoisomerase 1